jgi:hypothetical protein
MALSFCNAHQGAFVGILLGSCSDGADFVKFRYLGFLGFIKLSQKHYATIQAIVFNNFFLKRGELLGMDSWNDRPRFNYQAPGDSLGTQK